MMICSNCKYQFKTDIFENETYCPNCGSKCDYNKCSKGCTTIFDTPITLEDDECYCRKCGSKSTYFEQRLIKPYKID